jgi:hypothetical protein
MLTIFLLLLGCLFACPAFWLENSLVAAARRLGLSRKTSLKSRDFSPRLPEPDSGIASYVPKGLSF